MDLPTELTPDALEKALDEGRVSLSVTNSEELEVQIFNDWLSDEEADEDHDPSTIYVFGKLIRSYRHIAS